MRPEFHHRQLLLAAAVVADCFNARATNGPVIPKKVRMARASSYHFVSVIAIVGCGARSELTSDPDAALTDVSVLDDSEGSTTDDDGSAGGGDGDVASPSCPSACAHDQECEKACKPSLETGRYCCDLPTSTCYAWSTTICPEPPIFRRRLRLTGSMIGRRRRVHDGAPVVADCAACAAGGAWRSSASFHRPSTAYSRRTIQTAGASTTRGSSTGKPRTPTSRR